MHIRTPFIVVAAIASITVAHALVLVDEGFESPTWTVGTDISGKNGFASGSATGYVVTDLKALSGTQSILYNTAPTSGTKWAWKDSLVNAGVISSEVSVYIVSQPGRTAFSYFGLDIYSSLARIATLKVRGDGTVWYGAASTVNVGTAGLDQWVTLKVVTDLVNKTATAYVNGNKIGETLATPATDISDVDLVTNATGYETAYFDNLKVETVPEPLSIAAVGLGALAVIRKRRK